jgi:nicotinamide-nucleotide adenylyltransferase
MAMTDYDGYSLVIGRFQPLHEGHMDVIRKCASESERLIIGIGSAQYSHSVDNPFTAGERYLMIDKALEAEGISSYSIVPIEDINRYSVWVSHVVSMSPPFKRVYTNNPLTKRLFVEAGFEVLNSPLYNRSVYSGTEIRRRMAAGEDWRSLVPEAVAEVIDDIDGVERIKAIVGGTGDAPLRIRRAGGCPPLQGDPHVGRGILHRRATRCRDHIHTRGIGGFPGLRRHLQQRIEDVRPGRQRIHSHGPRRRQHRDRPRDGQGLRESLRLRCGCIHNRHSRARGRHP